MLPIAPISNSRGTNESWASYLDRLDEAISGPIFRLGLPTWLEFVVSVPASFFGTTAFLTVGPLWIALLEASDHREPALIHPPDAPGIALLQCLAAVATLGYLAAWGQLQLAEGYWLGKAFFWNKFLYALAYPWVLSVLAATVGRLPGDEARAIAGAALYPLVLFPFAVMLMTSLKARTRRPRPVLKDRARGGAWLARKRFPATPRFLAQYSGHESHPSGDVMLATLLALPLWDRRPGLAATLVVAAGLGRMYVLAHHLGDVLAGALYTLGLHRAAALLGYDRHGAAWWHPLLALACAVVFELWSKRDSGTASKRVLKKTSS